MLNDKQTNLHACVCVCVFACVSIIVTNNKYRNL